MADTPTPQASAITQIGRRKLKLEPGAFNQVLPQIIGNDKLGWYLEDHERFVDKLLPHLRDEEGNVADLKSERETLMGVLCPTEGRQRKALKKAFAATGYELDESAMAAFVLLLNVTGFGDYLSKKENPKTKKPFITKPKKGQKKKTFDDLMKEEVAAEASPETPAPKKPAAKPAKSDGEETEE